MAKIFDLFFGDSRKLSQPGHRLKDQIALALNAIGPQRALCIQQAKNTRYIFTLVRNNPEHLGIPRCGDIDLAHFIKKAYSIGEFENIWSVEGLGHVYCQRTWQRTWNTSAVASGILTDGPASSLPDSSLTMMHAGLGLCLSESVLKQLSPVSSSSEVERVLRTFIELCHNNSRRGYVGCALESLGLVTRCFNIQLVNTVQANLERIDPIAWEYFWHGAGRAIYFAPAHLLQPLYSPWIGLHGEAGNHRIRSILKAALTWPTNIVNMRTPEIFLEFIRRYGFDETNQPLIAHGVAASTTMAVDVTPNHPVVQAYLDYRPDTGDADMARLWELLVRNPVYNAVNRYQPILKRHTMMDQVFRVHDLDNLTAQLEANVTS